MEKQKTKSFLIKRSPKLTKKGVLVKQNYTRKGYSESGVRKPSSINLAEGDFDDTANQIKLLILKNYQIIKCNVCVS
jgi:hypothetical protein